MFLKKKKKKETTVIVSETIKESVAISLMMAMGIYLKESEQKAGSVVLIPKNLQERYEELVSLGLGNTQNAISLRNQLTLLQNREKDKKTAQDLISFLREAVSHFGPKTILVSSSQFNDLCRKYNLTTGILKDYSGVIPIQNIEDLKNVTSKISSFQYKDQLNSFGDGRYKLYIRKVVFGDNISKDRQIITDYLNTNGRIVNVANNEPHILDGFWWGSDILDIAGKLKWGNLQNFDGEILSSTSMLIACPKEFLNNPEVEISVNPVDPIIFQYCPYGVLIHTMWGEESEDIVLKKYKELNNII